MPRSLLRPALALSCTLLLAACGGSGTDGPTPAAGPDAVTPAAPSSPAPAPSAAPSEPSPAPPAATPAGLDTGTVQVLTTGLSAPWGLGFLPGGDALVTERDTARVLRVPAGGGEPAVVTTIGAAEPGGEGGLLGLAVSPTFADDGLVYVYVSADDDNRVLSFPLDDPARTTEVVTGIPRAGIHNGGRIAFGPDGLLYVGTGDAGETSRSQDPTSLGGKVLALDPAAGPYDAGDAAAIVFSSGHRNVQGLAFDDAGRLFTVEFGQNRFDEVNQVSRGDNGGWPEVEGPTDGGGRFLAPVVTWDPDEASPSGGAIVGDELYVAALRGQRLWQVPLDGAGGAGTPQALYTGDYGRLRTAVTAPDGALWVLTSNRDGRGSPAAQDDRVLRIPPVL